MIILGLYRPPIVSDIATKYYFVIFTVQCRPNAGAKPAIYAVSVWSIVSATSRSFVETVEQIELIFGVETSFHRFYVHCVV